MFNKFLHMSLLLSSSLAFAMNQEETSISISSISNRDSSAYKVSYSGHKDIITLSSQHTSKMDAKLLTASQQFLIPVFIKLREVLPEGSMREGHIVNSVKLTMTSPHVLTLLTGGHKEETFDLEAGRQYTLELSIQPGGNLEKELMVRDAKFAFLRKYCQSRKPTN